MLICKLQEDSATSADVSAPDATCNVEMDYMKASKAAEKVAAGQAWYYTEGPEDCFDPRDNNCDCANDCEDCNCIYNAGVRTEAEWNTICREVEANPEVPCNQNVNLGLYPECFFSDGSTTLTFPAGDGTTITLTQWTKVNLVYLPIGNPTDDYVFGASYFFVSGSDAAARDYCISGLRTLPISGPNTYFPELFTNVYEGNCTFANNNLEAALLELATHIGQDLLGYYSQPPQNLPGFENGVQCFSNANALGGAAAAGTSASGSASVAATIGLVAGVAVLVIAVAVVVALRRRSKSRRTITIEPLAANAAFDMPEDVQA